ncbi:MAG TPA: RdgB/HAM1 family non-canonical purine NTP pyrophosphatase [Dongiaceae bacterium]
MTTAYTISRERDPDAKERICRDVLDSLPDWFGIPEAIDRFCREVRHLPVWVAKSGGDALGFASVQQPFPATAELHLIAVRPAHHRAGVGARLLAEIEVHLKDTATRLLTVKTLAPSAGDRSYGRTHRFYAAQGFVPLEVFPTLWNEENPCLLMAKTLRTPRHFDGRKLVIASHNKGKLREMVELMAPFGIAVVLAGDLGLPEPDETEDSYIGNARLKALAAARASGLPALADDSGLSVDALGGAPGIYSARWADKGSDGARDFNIGMDRVLRELASHTNRRGCFVSALALCWPDGHCELFEGWVEGDIIHEKRGTRGFGYDPIFRPLGYDITFGEMDPGHKQEISHRAEAFRQLMAACFQGR